MTKKGDLKKMMKKAKIKMIAFMILLIGIFGIFLVGTSLIEMQRTPVSAGGDHLHAHC